MKGRIQRRKKMEEKCVEMEGSERECSGKEEKDEEEEGNFKLLERI